ncbi:hypothetical protein AB4Z46_04480 [Variovorax sp. M-6]|uniref:hypothetical protein n=1 Tax=Variovorax sp. M-6 TaxID=3233041 RepID=UPI003F96D0AB
MKRYRSRLFLLSVAACLAACATARTPEEKSPLGMSGIPPPPLVPQPEGTPLPPRDPRIAERWPPEIKRLVDNMLTLYAKAPDERPPTVKEVEQKMGITLTERPLKPQEARTWHKRFVISGTPYMDPPSMPHGGLGEFYGISRARPPGGMTQHLQLVTAPARSGYCLDPYELAVYTGSTFVNNDTSPHANVRSWSPAYVWGMFKWSNTSRYGGPYFSIILGQERDPTTRQILSTGCVSEIAVVGKYQEEEK